MNNQKGFSMVELIIVIAILGVFGTAILGLFYTGTRSYRDVGNDSDIQNEAQLTVNQIENLIIDSTRGLVYSYTKGAETNRVLSDAGVADPDKKTLSVYNANEMYIIEWTKEKKMYLQKNILDDTGKTTSEGSRVIMAENVADFSVSLEKAESKNKVQMYIEFLSTDQRKGFSTTKQISLRNELSINDITNAYKEASIPATVSNVDIFYDGQLYSEKSVDYFAHGAGAVSFSFSALVKGIGFPSQEVIWNLSSTSGIDSENTKISAGGQVTIAEDEGLDKVFTVTATAKDDNTKSSWVNIRIKQITGVSVAIAEESRADSYNNGGIVKVTANITGINLDDSDKTVNWSASGAQRLNTYSAQSPVQEYKITALVGADFVIKATSNADNGFSDSIRYTVANPYSISIGWDGVDTNRLLRNGISTALKATVEPNDSKYGDIYWEICYIENKTKNQEVTNSLKSTSGSDTTFSLTHNRGSLTSIRCGKNIDWSSMFSVGVRAYVKINNQYTYSNIIYINMDDVYIDIWHDSYHGVIRTADTNNAYRDNTGHSFKNSQGYVQHIGYVYDLKGYYNNDAVKVYKVSNCSDLYSQKYDGAPMAVIVPANDNITTQIRFEIDGKTWGYINTKIGR